MFSSEIVIGARDENDANTVTAVSMRSAFALALRGMSRTIVAFNFRMIRAFESFIDEGFS